MTSYIIIRKNKEEDKRKNNKEKKNLFKDIKNKINKKLVMTLRYGMIFFLKINLNKNHQQKNQLMIKNMFKKIQVFLIIIKIDNIKSHGIKIQKKTMKKINKNKMKKNHS